MCATFGLQDLSADEKTYVLEHLSVPDAWLNLIESRSANERDMLQYHHLLRCCGGGVGCTDKERQHALVEATTYLQLMAAAYTVLDAKPMLLSSFVSSLYTDTSGKLDPRKTLGKLIALAGAYVPEVKPYIAADACAPLDEFGYIKASSFKTVEKGLTDIVRAHLGSAKLGIGDDDILGLASLIHLGLDAAPGVYPVEKGDGEREDAASLCSTACTDERVTKPFVAWLRLVLQRFKTLGFKELLIGFISKPALQMLPLLKVAAEGIMPITIAEHTVKDPRKNGACSDSRACAHAETNLNPRASANRRHMADSLDQVEETVITPFIEHMLDGAASLKAPGAKGFHARNYDNVNVLTDQQKHDLLSGSQSSEQRSAAQSYEQRSAAAEQKGPEAVAAEAARQERVSENTSLGKPYRNLLPDKWRGQPEAAITAKLRGGVQPNSAKSAAAMGEAFTSDAMRNKDKHVAVTVDSTIYFKVKRFPDSHPKKAGQFHYFNIDYTDANGNKATTSGSLQLSFERVLGWVELD